MLLGSQSPNQVCNARSAAWLRWSSAEGEDPKARPYKGRRTGCPICPNNLVFRKRILPANCWAWSGVMESKVR